MVDGDDRAAPPADRPIAGRMVTVRQGVPSRTDPEERAMTAERDPASLRPRIRSKVWIERESEVLLSEWRVDLLEALHDTGSLAAAATAVGVPYRTAWERIKETEASLGIRLLETERGGADGGGSRLTDEAIELIARFRRVTAGLREAVEQRFEDEFGDLLR
jgi:molybdate transport system regulatory protein